MSEVAAGTGIDGSDERGLREVGRSLGLDVRELGRLRVLLAQEAPAQQLFGELAKDWLRRARKTRVRPDNDEWMVGHLAPLAQLAESQITKSTVEDLLGDLLEPRGSLSASSCNKVRSAGQRIVEDAKGNARWSGVNPFTLTRPMKQRQRLYQTLTLEEISAVLPFLRQDRRRLAKLVLLTGMRPGEALGLQKTEVDLRKKMIKVCRSHGRAQTKTGVEREFPMPDELVEDLRAAMADSPSEYVFPRKDGTRWRADTKLAEMLRVAMGKAGVVTGYAYVCRRGGCGHREQREEKLDLLCPLCAFKLQRTGIPKPLRFYDLRHTAATLHRTAGCDPMVIQDMLGHKKNLTDGTYTHVDSEYKRTQLNKLSLEGEAKK